MNNVKPIKIQEYGEISFYPFHSIIKENGGNEPYTKTVDIGIGLDFTFFKFQSQVYIIKPSEKSKKDHTKWLCAQVSNPVTIRSGEGSITGNCAKGVKEDYVTYLMKLKNANLSPEEIFRRITINIDNLN